jgi:hypothetical protein
MRYVQAFAKNIFPEVSKRSNFALEAQDDFYLGVSLYNSVTKAVSSLDFDVVLDFCEDDMNGFQNDFQMNSYRF